MKSYVTKFAMFMALSCGFAIAQSMPQQNPQSSSPTTPSASQPAPDQTQPAQPDQSTDQGKNPANAPESMPKSDQDKSADQSKMPQSDAAAAGSSDVQNQVQQALQQDPKLANANITVSVSGKNLELNGTVPSGAEKKAAEKIAKDKAGSLKVKNHIKVASANNAPGQDKSANPKPY
jgi:BON domain-containing protein